MIDRIFRRQHALLAFVAMVLIALDPVSARAAGGSDDGGARPGLEGARSWGYQLQHPDPGKLANAPYDVLVIDYSRDGGQDAALTAADLAKIKERPGQKPRIVLAYLSIGEAEVYRYYWRWTWGGKWYTNWLGWFFAPSWLGRHNDEWGGNYAVRYWDGGWQTVILGKDGYLDRIIAAGFDGVWLDKVDSSIEDVARKRPTAQDDMRDFVRKIAERGRAAKAGFLVLPQNGEELLSDAGYRRVIDGLGKEDLLFGEFKDKQANPERVIAKRIKLIEPLTAEGKPVLAVEYLDNVAEIEAARKRLRGLGFVPHFADRSLDHLRVGDVPSGHPSGKDNRHGKKPGATQ